MSAPKSTIQALLDEGFTADGFGTPADFATAGTGYLARLLTLAGAWVAQRVTQTTYDATTDSTSYAFQQMARAETLYASAVLWARRTKFMDGAATAGLQADQYKIIQYLQKQADSAMQAAFDSVAEALRALGMDAADATPGSNLSTSTVETGRFPSQQNPPGTVNWPFWPGEVVPW